jgi:hypothetical protein
LWAVDERTGRKEVVIMHKIRVVILLLVMLAGAGRVQATIVEFYEDWIIHEGDEYDEVHIYNDATIGITGGEVGHLYANDSSTVNLFDGVVYSLYAYDSSTIYIYGGLIDRSVSVADSSIASLYGGMSGAEVRIFDSGIVRIYGYGFEWEPTLGGETGWLSGYWLDGTSFSRMYLRNLPEPFPGSQVVLIPEPGALLLLALGSLGLRKRSFSR